ncbi:NAD(P)-binding protein [Nemania abortiva]|nr:NAD(P)-binding protein [Nemania abortiva]
MAPPPGRTFDITPEKEARQTSFIYRQFFVTPPVVSASEVNLHGKTAIVTGANVGLGLECCRQLLRLGLTKLILAVRDESKGAAAKDKLATAKRDPGATIEVWSLDLSRYESVTAFVARAKELDRLDILVLNAGTFTVKYQVNPETQHDQVIQVNYISTALLTVLMLPVVQAKNTPENPGRIVLVNSETAAWAKWKERSSTPLLKGFDDPKTFQFVERYYCSKLLAQMFLVELAKRVPPTVAVITSCNPGLCYGSSLHRDTEGTIPGFIFGTFKRIIGRTTEVGARTLTDAAVKHGNEIHGQYLGDCKLKPMAPLIYQPKGIKLAETLWQETMAELSFANVEGVIEGLQK